MRTAIDKRLDRARLVAIEDDRRIADPGGAVIARLRDFAVEAEIAPHRPAEDSLLLAGIDFGIVVEAVRNPAVIERRPSRSGDHRHLPLSLRDPNRSGQRS